MRRPASLLQLQLLLLLPLLSLLPVPHPAAAFSLESFELIGEAERSSSGSVRLTHDDLGAPTAGGLFSRSAVGPRWEFQLLLNAHGRRNSGGAGFAFWYVADPVVEIGDLFGGPGEFYGFALFLSSSSSSSVSSPSIGRGDSASGGGGGGGWAGGFFNDGGPFDRQELAHGRTGGRNSCRLNFRNHVVNDRGPTLLRITYDGSDLSVRVSEPQVHLRARFRPG
jgi:hypothetical protein